MNQPVIIILSFAAVLFFSGCMQSTAYHWGDYEEQVYRMYAVPDKATAAAQIDVFELDIEKARSTGKPLAPGVRAHMGYLYFQLGRHDEARQAFEAEKLAFPESAQLMDRFIQKIGTEHV